MNNFPIILIALAHRLAFLHALCPQEASSGVMPSEPSPTTQQTWLFPPRPPPPLTWTFTLLLTEGADQTPILKCPGVQHSQSLTTQGIISEQIVTFSKIIHGIP